MLRTMVTQLIQHDGINTTLPKAKELRRLADKMVTLAKTGTLHARRQAAAVIRDENMVLKLFTEAPIRFAGRNGGYCRVERLTRNRYGDNAPMARISYLQEALLPDPGTFASTMTKKKEEEDAAALKE